MDEIRAWLNSNRPYETGAQLYRTYGKDPLLLRLFNDPYSAYKEKKLAEVLQALAPCCESCEHGHTCESDVPAVDDRAKFLEEKNEELHDENMELQDKVDDL